MAKEELGFVPEVRDPPRTYPPPPPVSRCSSLRHANKNRAVLRTRGRRVHWCEESALKARGAQAPWATPELLGMADEYPVRRNASAFALRRVGEDPGRRAYDEFAERRAEASPEAGPTNRGSGRAGAVSECRVSTAARLTARAPDRRLGTSGSSRSPRRRPTRSPSRGGGSLGRPTSTGIASGRSLMPTPRSSSGRRGSRRLRSQCPTTSQSIGPPPRTTACCSPCPSLCCTALRARRARRVKEKVRLLTMVAKPARRYSDSDEEEYARAGVTDLNREPRRPRWHLRNLFGDDLVDQTDFQDELYIPKHLRNPSPPPTPSLSGTSSFDRYDSESW
jgi:hypothetical protein